MLSERLRQSLRYFHVLMALPHRLDLSISGIVLRIESDLPIHADTKFLPFLTESTAPDLTARIERTVHLPELSEDILHEDLCYRVHPDGWGGYLRSFFDAPRDLTPYAVSAWDSDERVLTVRYLSKGSHCLSELGSCLFHLGLEHLLLQQERLCLHAALVRTDVGGILFSGPSGIGKSTQAELWCRHRSAVQLNGDRPILSRIKDGWLGWGSPYAGSSRCHINDSCPIHAIVMLRQAPQCSLRRLSVREAFRAVWFGLAVNHWDADQVRRASDLALELICAVPVLEFSCTPDLQAVEYLEQTLKEVCEHAADRSGQCPD